MALRSGRYFTFTLNNYTPEEENKIKSVECRYIIFGHEVAPDTGTPHLQGYIQFQRKMSPTYVKRICPRIHWENAKGNGEQNKTYCSKGTDIFEKGNITPAKKGARKDIAEIKEMVKNNKPMCEILEVCSNYQQIRVAEKLYEYKPLSPLYKKKLVYWYWGNTGSGKTKACYDEIAKSGKDFWRSSATGGKWFNGYYGQPIALLDEVRAGEWKYSLMLQILDGYEIRLECKGGFVIWNPEEVYITSPKSPQDCYEGQLQYGDGHIDQLMRRITEVIHFEDVVPLNIINIEE